MKNIKTFKLFESNSLDSLDLDYIRDILVELEDIGFIVDIDRNDSYSCFENGYLVRKKIISIFIDMPNSELFRPNSEFIQCIQELYSHLKNYEITTSLLSGKKNNTEVFLDEITNLSEYSTKCVQVAISYTNNIKK